MEDYKLLNAAFLYGQRHLDEEKFMTIAQEWAKSQHDGKPIVSRSVEFEKPQPTLSADEIKSTAEMLWKKPMKLEAVKMVMKLGYSLKDAKAYCELHFG